MDICTQKIESYYKGSLTRLWNKLPGETVDETWEKVEDWNDENIARRIPLPATTAVMLHAVSRWSKTRVVYRFNKYLAEELTELSKTMKKDDPLPAQFLRLPYEAVSLQLDTSDVTQKLKELGFPVDGIFGEDMTFTVTETRPGEIHPWPCILSTLTGPIGITTLVLPIGKTVGESIVAALEFENESQHWIAAEYRRLKGRNADMPGVEKVDDYQAGSLKQLIQLLLYINSIESDQQNPEERTDIDRAERKRIRREISEKKLKMTDVGYHIGRLLKAGRETSGSGTGTGGKKRAHFRRAHWHHYWVGKQDGDRELILKWVLATAIHPEKLDDKPTVMMC